MVISTEQDQVGQAGRSAIGPVLDVVGVGPTGRNRAPGEGAAAVPQYQGSAQRVASVVWWLTGESAVPLHGAVIDASMGLGVHPGLISQDAAAPVKGAP